MTLAARMNLATLALALSLVAISVAALWGINGLSRGVDVALGEYQKLRAVYEIGPTLVRAKSRLEAGEGNDRQVLAELHEADVRLSMVLGDLTKETPALRDFRQMVARLERADDPGKSYELTDESMLWPDPPPALEEQIAVINGVIGHLAKIGSESSQIITATHEAARAQRRATAIAVATVAAAMTLAAMLISLWLYRAVMGPLRALRRGVRTIARGQFTDRLDPRGDREFQELARDFNQMAGELDELYRELEAKVAAKSKELARSERLASVGFLAAGVAHEINNPLGIISGYAELSMRKLRNQIADGAASTPPNDATLKALQVICDEAFRCKQIIEKLLGLARGGSRGPTGEETAEERRPVPLTKVARDVIDLVQGLPRYRDRLVELHSNGDAASPLTVSGNETELKQVVLNLVINALEATEAKTGRVHIDLHRTNQHVRLIVRDNGKGMSLTTLDRIFEPFYTDKRGGGEGEARGTGLGLSISHAIIQQHGGALRAASDGPGKGSTLTVELPAG